jgi:predicted transcriptional regulator
MAQAAAVRIDRVHHQVLRQLAERMGESMQAVVERAIDELKRQQFFEELDAAFTALRADEGAWQEEAEERALWESTLGDGIGLDGVSAGIRGVNTRA